MSNQLIFDENPIETTLTAKEQLQIEEYCTAINMADSTAVIDYGSDIQKKLSELSSRMLANLNSQSMDNISDVLDTTLRYLSCVEEEPKTKKGLFSRKPKERSAREKYQDAEKNVDRVTVVLQQHQIQLMKDCAMLTQLYEMNKVYFRELNIRIEAGKRKLEQCRKVDLPALEQHARTSGLAQDAQAVADLKNQMDRLEKKVHELELTGSVALQSAPLIRMIQSNQSSMAAKLQSTLLNTIPLWKNQVIMALNMEQTKENLSAEKKTQTSINKLIKQNTGDIRMASEETVHAASRNFQDVNTLEATNKELIENLTNLNKEL
ncbi:MAG: toxic anion resistance protein [Lachnospiraceae bacterium]|nr:toxic anion resistance protein [Lachnospiraceae bacterium]